MQEFLAGDPAKSGEVGFDGLTQVAALSRLPRTRYLPGVGHWNSRSFCGFG